MSLHTINVYKYFVPKYIKLSTASATAIMNDTFKIRINQYNLRNSNIFYCDNPHTSRYGLKSISYRANQIWNTLPEELKNLPSLASFKNNIKTWKADKCLCNICKTYIANLGYL